MKEIRWMMMIMMMMMMMMIVVMVMMNCIVASLTDQRARTFFSINPDTLRAVFRAELNVGLCNI